MLSTAKNSAARVDFIAVFLLLALGLGIGLGGSARVPLDAHEVYVAQTANNMIASGDWIVPRLNHALRLTKPPLSYWATAGIALLGADHHVTPLDVRMPSILAGLGLVLIVFVMGRAEGDRATGLLAGLIALTSLGFFRYVHDGRPDMLYAFFATLMLFAWLSGRRARRSSAIDAWALLFWAAFGLHTLTKGPQFGAILLAACLVHALCVPAERRSLRARLRPLTGALLFAAIVIPWWWLLGQRVGPELEQSQLAGKLITVDPLRLLHAFYWLRTPLQWAPWLIPVVAAAVAAWRERRRTPGLLATVVLLAIVVFTLGPQYREVYVLPTLAPAALLLALGVQRLERSDGRTLRFGFWVLALFLTVFCLGGLVWLALHTRHQWLTFALCAAASVALVGLGLARSRRTRAGVTSMLAIAIAAALIQAAVTPAVWSASRYNDRDIAVRLLAYRQRSMAVFDRLAPEIFVYYLQRPLVEIDDAAALCRWLADPANQGGVLLYHPAQAPRVEPDARGLTRLMASPGSERSAVVASGVGRNAGCATGQ